MSHTLHLTGRIWREGDDYVSVIGYVEEIGYEAAATEAHPDAATFSLEVPIHGDAA